MTARVRGFMVADVSMRPPLRMEAFIISIASAAAVVPSYIEALETSMPVNDDIMLWYSNI